MLPDVCVTRYDRIMWTAHICGTVVYAVESKSRRNIFFAGGILMEFLPTQFKQCCSDMNTMLMLNTLREH